MSKPVIFTYGKKRSYNDYQNSMFDRLIQDVSNNNKKKTRAIDDTSTASKVSQSTDAYDFNCDNETRFRPSLRKPKPDDMKSPAFKPSPTKKKKKQTTKALHKKPEKVFAESKSTRTTRNSCKLLKSPNGQCMSANDTPSKCSSSAQSSINDGSSVDNSFVDEQIEVKLKEPAAARQTMQKKACLQPHRTTVYDDVDDVYDFNSAPILFKAKSSPDLQQSPNTSSETSPSSRKFIGTKKIFTNNANGGANANSQAKRNNAQFNYNLFDFSDTTLVQANKTAQEGSTVAGDEYTVLRDPRKAYECEELGETQSILDDTSYLMDGLSDNFQLANRCLSALKLAEYCVNSEFRMHLRSHGIVAKIFTLLHDSHKDFNLALCASCIMYTLSRDKLLMDLDKKTLELMIMILNMDVPKPADVNTQLYKKNMKYCIDICTKLEKCALSVDKLDFDSLNANLLAMECLLSLTNRRAGDWCKEELRLLGAFDHILNTVDKCLNDIKNAIAIQDNILKYVRCLKVLENVTHSNPENQNYLAVYRNSILIGLFKESLMCFVTKLKKTDKLTEQIKAHYTDAIKTTFSLMVNITNQNPNGSEKIANDDDLINTMFVCIHEGVDVLVEDRKFDVLIMAFGVLLNLLHLNENFQKSFIRHVNLLNHTEIQSVDIVISIFNKKQNEVVDAEKDQEKEWIKLNNEIESQNVENINSSVMNSIHKAGKHMEDHIIAAHSAVVLGYILILDQKVTGFSADEKIQEILKMLEKLNKTQ